MRLPNPARMAPTAEPRASSSAERLSHVVMAALRFSTRLLNIGLQANGAELFNKGIDTPFKTIVRFCMHITSRSLFGFWSLFQTVTWPNKLYCNVSLDCIH